MFFHREALLRPAVLCGRPRAFRRAPVLDATVKRRVGNRRQPERKDKMFENAARFHGAGTICQSVARVKRERVV